MHHKTSEPRNLTKHTEKFQTVHVIWSYICAMFILNHGICNKIATKTALVSIRNVIERMSYENSESWKKDLDSPRNLK